MPRRIIAIFTIVSDDVVVFSKPLDNLRLKFNQPSVRSTIGFSIFAGDQAQNWLMMKNGEHVIGLFQGMFEKNILTFNPGWNCNAEKLENFTDIREIQKKLKAEGIKFTVEADENSTGAAHSMLVDPDGNTILLDQHV